MSAIREVLREALRGVRRQPIVVFLVLGAMLFVAYRTTGGRTSLSDDLTVVVDDERLRSFLQYRSRAFDPRLVDRMLASFSGEEVDRLVDDLVREEVLYREALAMKMDEQDYVIRRRLVQSMESLTSSFVTAATELSETEIRGYYDEHRDDYYVRPQATFTHVYFDRGRHGPEAARRLAVEKSDQLTRERVPFHEATRHGDRFPYHANYVERDQEFVASHFGQSMAESVFELEADESRWQGPFESSFGVHLVLLARLEPGRYPELDEVRERVAADARRRAVRERQEEAVQAIVAGYTVERTFRIPDAVEDETETETETDAAAAAEGDDPASSPSRRREDPPP